MGDSSVVGAFRRWVVPAFGVVVGAALFALAIFTAITNLVHWAFAPAGPAAELHALTVVSPQVRAGEMVRYEVLGERYRMDCPGDFAIRLIAEDHAIWIGEGTLDISTKGPQHLRAMRLIPATIPPGLYEMEVTLVFECPDDDLQVVRSPGGDGAKIEVLAAR